MNIKLARVCVLVWGLTLMGCAATDRTMVANQLRLGLDFDHTSQEVVVNGGSGVDVDSTSIGIAGGYRVVPNFEIGGVIAYTDDSVSGGGSTETYQIGPAARYYFVDRGNMQPWVSAGFGIASADDVVSLDGSYYELGVGVSYFASPWAAFEASVTYTDISLEADSVGGFAGDEVDADGLSYNLGISVFF